MLNDLFVRFLLTSQHINGSGRHSHQQQTADAEHPGAMIAGLGQIKAGGIHNSQRSYECSVVSGDLVLKEHEAARWLTAETIADVNWLPADRVILNAVYNILGKIN